MSLEDGLTGSTWCGWASCTGSPPCAFESKLGGEESASSWAPARSTTGGSADSFAQRRQTEWKHCESQGQSSDTEAAAADFGWTGLTFCHAAEEHPWLAVEIANVRCVMTAIFGMPLMDGSTGSARGV